MKKVIKRGFSGLFIVAILAAAIVGYVRTRPIDVAIKPLPEQPQDNSFYAINRLALKTHAAAEESFTMRHGRSQLPYKGDLELRRKFMEEMQDFRDQYLPLVGKPFMPPKRFSFYDQPYLGEGVIYWCVAEAVALDDLFVTGKFDDAATQLSTTIRFSNQMMQHADAASMVTASFMQSRSIAVLEEHFRSIPAAMAERFMNFLIEGLETMPPLDQLIDAEEAATILGLGHERKLKADKFWDAYFDYRDLARDAKKEFDRVRRGQHVPFAKREKADKDRPFLGLYVPDDQLWWIYDKLRLRLQLYIVALAIRDFKHKHGDYPKALDELGMEEYVTDPFTGESLLYRTGPKGFLLYARGMDGDDDQGKQSLSLGMKDGDFGVLYPVRDMGTGTLNLEPVWLR